MQAPDKHASAATLLQHFATFGQGLNFHQRFWLELKSQILQERKKKTMCGATPVHNLIRNETKSKLSQLHVAEINLAWPRLNKSNP